MDHTKDSANDFESTLNALLLNACDLSAATVFDYSELTRRQNDLLDHLMIQWNELPDDLI